MSHSSEPSAASKQTAAALMSFALLRLFPTAQFLGTEKTPLGFCCDLLLEQPIDNSLLELIEQEMHALIKSNLPIKELSMMRENAAAFLLHKGYNHRAAAAATHPSNIVELIQIGDNFFDLCPSTASSLQELGIIKVLAHSNIDKRLSDGSYATATRIEGAVFTNKQALKVFLKRREAAKKRDHRHLGPALNLFSLLDASSSSWVWHPKGVTLREELLAWWKQKHLEQGFRFLSTPQLLAPSLIKKVGGTRFISLFSLPPVDIEGATHLLSSKRALAHAHLFAREGYSHSQLPVRTAEWTLSIDTAPESELYGMMRSREWLSDEAYLFCTAAQLLDELISSLQFIDKMIRLFSFEPRWSMKTRAARAFGTEARWKESQRWLEEAWHRCFNQSIAKEEEALFGPYIEASLLDAMGRAWPGPFIAIDLFLPEELDLCYKSSKGSLERVFMAARRTFRSFERCIALLLEHESGKLPLWLAPEQVRIIPIKESNGTYARELAALYQRENVRAEVDLGSQGIKEKVYNAECERIPYLAIVGDREENEKAVAVRRFRQGNQGEHMQATEFLALLHHEIGEGKKS